MEGGELFAKISERTTPFTEQGLPKTTKKDLIYINIFFYFIILWFQEVAKIMHQICSAVKHLHAMRIVHRGSLIYTKLTLFLFLSHSFLFYHFCTFRFKARKSFTLNKRQYGNHKANRFWFRQRSLSRSSNTLVNHH